MCRNVRILMSMKFCIKIHETEYKTVYKWKTLPGRLQEILAGVPIVLKQVFFSKKGTTVKKITCC